MGASAAWGLPRGASCPPSWPSASLPRAWAGPGSSQHPGLRLLALNCESLMWAHTCSQARSQRAWTSVRPLVRTGQAPGRSLPRDAPGKPPPVIHRGAGGLGVPGVGQAASPLDPTSHLGTRHPRVGVWREGWREVLSSGVGGVGGVPGWLLPESRGWMHWFGAHPGHGKHAPQGPLSCGHGPAVRVELGLRPPPGATASGLKDGPNSFCPQSLRGTAWSSPPKAGSGCHGRSGGRACMCTRLCVWGRGAT